jgi:branched-chain amino acid transport system substrate-binding protein
MRRILLLLFLSLFLLTACSQSSLVASADEQEVVRIGVSAPLTGEAASYGDNAVAGVRLALHDHTDGGYVDGKKVEFYIEDDLCSAKAANVFAKLVDVDRVDVIVGPFCSGAAGSALPMAQEKGVPVLLPGASAPGLTEVGDFIFRIYPSDAFQGGFAANYAYDVLGARKVAVLYVLNDWGEGIQRVFKESFEALGGEIVYLGGTAQENNDFKTDIQKIVDAEADLIYAPVYMVNGISLGKQLKEMGVDVPVLAGDAQGGDESVKSESCQGFLVPIAKFEMPESLADRAKRLEGYESLETNFALPYYYDAASIALQVVNQTTDDEAMRALLDEGSFSGVTNELIEFDEHGDLIDVEFEMLQIKDYALVPYVP